MKNKILMIGSLTAVMMTTSNSAAVLVDINADATNRDASVADFEDAIGLTTGALSGSTVTTYDLGNSGHTDPGSQSLDLTVDNIRLEVSAFSAEADNWFGGATNLLLDDGLYLRDGGGTTTSLITISGSGLGLAANTTYDLYLFASAQDEATFNFDPSDLSDPSGGTAAVVGPATTGDETLATAKYTFTTGGVAPSELVFSWSDAAGGDAGFSGFALQAVPEPSSTLLLGLGGLALILRRRK